jgi:hypothetical protein
VSSNEVDKMRWARRTNWRNDKCIKVFADNPEGNRPIGQSKRRWEDNIKLHLKETGWEGVDLIHVAELWDEWRAFVKL